MVALNNPHSAWIYWSPVIPFCNSVTQEKSYCFQELINEYMNFAGNFDAAYYATMITECSQLMVEEFKGSHVW